MSEESNAALLRAYRSAVEAGQGVLADLLEGVILEAMKGGRTSPIVIGGSRTPLEPPGKVTGGPDTVKLGTTMEWTGIDTTERKVTS